MDETDETYLLAAGMVGRVLDLGADGRRGSVDASVLRRCCHELKDQIDPRGIRLRNAVIVGIVDLAGLEVPFPLRFEDCEFDSPLLIESAQLHELALTGCARVPGVLANGVRIRRDLDLSGSWVTGALNTSASTSKQAAIWLCESDIGGRLLCVDTVIDGGGERSIQADRMHVSGTIRLLHQFTARAEIRLIGARIEGSLDLTGALIETNSASGLALDLGEAVIDGSIFVVPDQRSGRRPLIRGWIDIGGARVGGQFLIRNATLLAQHAMRVIQGTGTLCEVYAVRRYGAIERWPVRERIELPHLIHRTGHHVHHTTGFDREEIIDLCIRINSVQPGAGSPNWPPCLGLFKSVVATLTYMRHNRTQAEIGESLRVSQPTISRAISAITPLVPEATREFVPTADDLDPDAQYILDGTLLPCWSWGGRQELYSGKHKTTGMNVQVACTIYGKLAWISDPVNGSRHDNYCREESGVLLTMNPKNWIGDKGYIGNNMITPFRKPAGGELVDWQKEYNSEVNKIRWMIEQVISHFKNWTIMHTDYRRPLKTFETTISAVVGLHFYRTA